MSTPTPRTDAAWASSFEECEYRAAHTARTMRECSQQLETELAALAAECDRTYNHECINRLATATGTLGEKSEKVVEVALSTIAELRSGVERLNALGSWAHTCIHHTDEERKAWAACPCCAIARAERAEAELATAKERLRSEAMDDYAAIKDLQRELATERAKVKLREVWLCGHTDGIDCGSGQRSASDFVTFDEAEAKKHVAKYKGSWTTEGWYRSIPVRAPVAIDAAMKEGGK